MATLFPSLFWHVSSCKKQQSSFITKCDRLLLQYASGITKFNRLLWQSAPGIAKCGTRYYKVHQVLQSVTVSTKWDVAPVFFLKNRWNYYKLEVTNLLLKPLSYNYPKYVTYVAFYIFSITFYKNMGPSELKNLILLVEVTNMFQGIIFEYLKVTFVVNYKTCSYIQLNKMQNKETSRQLYTLR